MKKIMAIRKHTTIECSITYDDGSTCNMKDEFSNFLINQPYEPHMAFQNLHLVEASDKTIYEVKALEIIRRLDNAL